MNLHASFNGDQLPKRGILRCKGSARAIDQLILQSEAGSFSKMSFPWRIHVTNDTFPYLDVPGSW